MKHTLALFAIASLAAGPGCAVPSSDGPGEELGTVESPLTITGFGWVKVFYNGTIDAPARFNSSGGTITASRPTPGRYTVVFNGIPENGRSNAHVVAVGPDNYHCKITSMPTVAAAKTTINVGCYNAAGAAVSTGFLVFIDSRSGLNPVTSDAYATVSSGASVSRAWMANGGTPTATWSATSKTYSVQFPGVTDTNAGINVTAVGNDGKRCKVLAGSGSSTSVKCHDGTGAEVQSGFTISRRILGMVAERVGGHALTVNGSLQPGMSRSSQAGGFCGPAAVFSTTPGTNSVSLALTNSDFSPHSYGEVMPMVTAHGNFADYCNVLSWSLVSPGTTTVVVRCYDSTGAARPAANSSFMGSITSKNFAAPC